MTTVLRRLKFLVVAGLLVLVLAPTPGLTQMGGWPGGGGGGWGGRSRDPNDRFNEYTGGKDVWRRSEITDPNLQMRFDFTARMAGSTNGEITREQFLVMSQRFQAMRGAPGGFGAPPVAAPGAPSAAPTAAAALPAPGTPPGMPGGANWMDAMIEARFRSYDRNGDGLLNNDEMPESLRAEREKWDTNKDGFISLDEFKEYARARVSQMQVERGGNGGAGWGGQAPQGAVPPLPLPLEDEAERRPTVYRATNLPKELPSWFREADVDGDAQIGLYEWRAKGWAIEEFEKMDRNKDGFLTVDEVLHYLKQPKESAVANTMAGGMPMMGGAMPAMGSGGPPRMGPGGPPGGMPSGGNAGGPSRRLLR